MDNIIVIFSLSKEIARKNSVYYNIICNRYPQIFLAENGADDLLGISIPDSKSLLKYRPIFGNYIPTASKWKTLFVISCSIFV